MEVNSCLLIIQLWVSIKLELTEFKSLPVSKAPMIRVDITDAHDTCTDILGIHVICMNNLDIHDVCKGIKVMHAVSTR